MCPYRSPGLKRSPRSSSLSLPSTRMASAGQAQAHSSQPMHFSRPSGCRLSWWRPWERGSVVHFTSGYSWVATLRNIVAKVTPNPATGPKSSAMKPFSFSSATGLLLLTGGRRAGQGLLPALAGGLHETLARQWWDGVATRPRVDLRGDLGRLCGGLLLGLDPVLPDPHRAEHDHREHGDDDQRGDREGEAEDVDGAVTEEAGVGSADEGHVDHPGSREWDEQLP